MYMNTCHIILAEYDIWANSFSHFYLYCMAAWRNLCGTFIFLSDVYVCLYVNSFNWFMHPVARVSINIYWLIVWLKRMNELHLSWIYFILCNVIFFCWINFFLPLPQFDENGIHTNFNADLSLPCTKSAEWLLKDVITVMTDWQKLRYGRVLWKNAGNVVAFTNLLND
jgi:hypothetical protein